MAIIVKHKQNGKKYVLVGSGFGVHKGKKSFLMGKSTDDSSYFDMLCCANKKGELGWFKTAEIEVVSIDGVPVTEFDITE